MSQQANINNPDFECNVSKTDVQATWRKHGWTPTTEDERAERARQPYPFPSSSQFLVNIQQQPGLFVHSGLPRDGEPATVALAAA